VIYIIKAYDEFFKIIGNIDPTFKYHEGKDHCGKLDAYLEEIKLDKTKVQVLDAEIGENSLNGILCLTFTVRLTADQRATPSPRKILVDQTISLRVVIPKFYFSVADKCLRYKIEDIGIFILDKIEKVDLEPDFETYLMAMITVSKEDLVDKDFKKAFDDAAKGNLNYME
jgi:hypothetical protein